MRASRDRGRTAISRVGNSLWVISLVLAMTSFSAHAESQNAAPAGGSGATPAAPATAEISWQFHTLRVATIGGTLDARSAGPSIAI